MCFSRSGPRFSAIFLKEDSAMLNVALERLDVVIATIAFDTGLKSPPREAIHNWGEDEFSLMH